MENIAEADTKNKSPLWLAAIEIVKDGGRVIPIHAGKKTPRFNDWHGGAFESIEAVNEHWAESPQDNIAVCPEDLDLCVIDLDPEHEPIDLPETYTVATPRDGEHRYYLGSLPPSVGKLGAHIDTRGRRSYVLVPPSIVDGKVYSLKQDVAPVVLPDWVYDGLKQADKMETAPEGITMDDPGNISRAQTFLANHPVAMTGHGGNNRTYQTVATLKDLGVSQDNVPKVIAAWNERCVPPWSPEELATVITNVYTYGQNEPGAYATAAPEVTFAEAVKALPIEETPSIVPKLLKPLSFQELAARPTAPVRELIPGLIERGIATMLSGAGGTHKSRVALQWGLMLHVAMPIYGRKVEQCTFIYWDYENGADEVARRVQKMRFRLQLPDLAGSHYFDFKSPAEAGSAGDVPVFKAQDALAVISDTGIDVTQTYYDLVAFLKSIPGHKFIVADSCYNILRFTGNSKINETAVKAALNLLDYVCSLTDSTMLYLWHPSQAGQDRGDASGWSVAWHNTPRARLSLTKDQGSPDVFDLKVEKRNNGRAGDIITLHWQEGILAPGGAASNPEGGKRLLDACVHVALAAAERGTPLQRRSDIPKAARDEIERRAGFRPGLTEIRKTLEEGVQAKLLRYLAGRSHVTAGYYRNDIDPDNAAHFGIEEAERLADQAGLRDMLKQ